MELSNTFTAFLFLLLAIVSITSVEDQVPEGASHGLWRGELTTVTAQGGMLSTQDGNYWLTSTLLAETSLKGDSILVTGYRRGMFISPFGIRLKPSTSYISNARRHYRNRLFETIHDPVARGLTGGLLMGLRGLITSETATAFKNSGTSHMLALSGLHTGIIALLLLFLSRLLLGRGIISGWVAVLGIILFVVLSGGRSSTVRAGIMASFAVLWISHRGGRLHLLTVWWTALILSLLFMPGILKDKGAQMSYGAVLSLIIFGRRFTGRNSVVFSPLYAGIVVTVSLAPLIIHIYGGLSLLGPTATVVSLPFMLAVMILGFLSSAGLFELSIVLTPLAGCWIEILNFFSHAPLEIPNFFLYPAWALLLIGLRLFSRWNGLNRRFR